MADFLEHLAGSLGPTPATRRLPPVETWHPPLSGDIDIRIDSDGMWHHEGTPFQRLDLARLFASILVRERGDYFLVTPVEKWRIQVDDVPFVFVLMKVEAAGQPGQTLRFCTALDDEVVAGERHPIRLHPYGPDAQLVPYLPVRRNLEGRVSRSVFYQLVDLVEPPPSSEGTPMMGVMSDGLFFALE